MPLERTISGKFCSDVEWLLLATMKSKTRIFLLRKSGELPDPAEVSGSNSAGFTYEESG